MCSRDTLLTEEQENGMFDMMEFLFKRKEGMKGRRKERRERERDPI